MKAVCKVSCFVLTFLVSAVLAQEEPTAPRTGYYELSMTPADVLGDSGAQGVASILPVDEEIDWQVYVPANYSASSPPGVVVYVSPWESGGPPRKWNDMLEAQNLIWIGANDSGNELPVPERMLKAMIAPTALRRSYVIDPERSYVAGFSGGGITATRIATAKPDLFKGGVYMGGTVFWKDNTPPKLDLVRENHHVFLVGTYDPALKTTRRVYRDYKAAGVGNSELMTIRNHKHRMPPVDYFEKAIAYLDSRIRE